jgi:DNA-binding phage protein
MYDTYRFRDKDPIIDVVHTCVDIFATIHNIKFGRALKLLSTSSGVSQSCLYNWFSGSTRMPRFATVMAVVHATGRDIKITDTSVGSKPRFKVLKGGKAA